ncbi:MAG: IS66 family transposase [Terriglobia bacterium]
MARKSGPEIVLLAADELDWLLAQLRAALPAQLYQRVEALLRTLQWLWAVIEEKKTSLRRLRRVLFGARTEKTDSLFPNDKEGQGPSTQDKPAQKPKRKGHGRNGAQAYSGAKRICVHHAQLKAGGVCPKCKKGKLYLLGTPARLVRIMAQPIFSAVIHELERLRCALCGAVFTAAAPPEAGASKYDPSVGIMLAVMRYGAGQPLYRMDKWQSYFGVPLPASTQWELIEEASHTPGLIYDALIDAAAQATLLYQDDTTMRVQSLGQPRANPIPPGDPQSDSRTGVFTTGIVAQIGAPPGNPNPQGGRRVALFFTGQNHAGENLDQLLKRRAPGLEKPIQMCDALSRNVSREFETILCNCLLHARRGFVDAAPDFPEECRRVIESLREVYRTDALAKQNNLSAIERLALHQERSRPVMDQLHGWMRQQFDEKRVEPNSGLGQAISYMVKHWEKLTRFLEVPGAPLDNNTVERALKMAILHRKNSLFFRTLNGARIGDIFMSPVE